ncbi:ABC transporter ATP-binding protein [Sporomusa sphaeroides]|uniref:ABC transporter ATP-binding protein n=1 Tax=Sporomusa sphaeroides DSM 2875 TaxID=1337886 RepID=A0ABM9WA28_9FIRM|nr:ABC transporter ATP-binding protein [Sporomusa sphaeroides]OLS55617.1 putative ABC transporter ATP-binding protein [Sporomusa sphaeroides DSM 2875]CVK21466.1 putative ABC transporter ATP-binding protein [Sporomusa sphaeroides DSM 2875]
MILEVKHGYFGYTKDNDILRDISFVLGEQEIMTILGPNGIGKTTMLKCMTGILQWTQGQTLINGTPMGTSREVQKHYPIGYVPQAHSLSFPYTVREVVTMGRARHIGVCSVPSRYDKEIVDKAMEQVGIVPIRDKPCTQLSGGQLQLVFIARALAGEPKVLVLDEPESHLDFKNQFMMLHLIKTLVKERGISCIMNTHYPEHALRLADTTLLLGKNSYLFGKTQEIITEQRVKEYFDIEAKILSVPYHDESIKAFVVLESFDRAEEAYSSS